jgi:hypothetical protein
LCAISIAEPRTENPGTRLPPARPSDRVVDPARVHGTLIWSRDAKRLAVLAAVANGSAEIWVLDLPSKRSCRVAALPAGPRLSGATWTSDDTLIVGMWDVIGDIVLFEREE